MIKIYRLILQKLYIVAIYFSKIHKNNYFTKESSCNILVLTFSKVKISQKGGAIYDFLS